MSAVGMKKLMNKDMGQGGKNTENKSGAWWVNGGENPFGATSFDPVKKNEIKKTGNVAQNSKNDNTPVISTAWWTRKPTSESINDLQISC